MIKASMTRLHAIMLTCGQVINCLLGDIDPTLLPRFDFLEASRETAGPHETTALMAKVPLVRSQQFRV